MRNLVGGVPFIYEARALPAHGQSVTFLASLEMRVPLRGREVTGKAVFALLRIELMWI